jgi:hypothetical protein
VVGDSGRPAPDMGAEKVLWQGGGVVDQFEGQGVADGELAVGDPLQVGVGVTNGVRAVGEGVHGGTMLGVGSRRSERDWSGLSAVA